ncbi:MAG: hypothetical protein LLF78_03015 [Synergistaceae bacterium]|nr:hypothetical protein [Synergistaceae bacterium]
MRLLALLLLGTLIFGFAFPAAIMLIGLFGLLIFAAMIFGLLRGATFSIYTNRKGHDPFAAGSRPESTPDNPEIIDAPESAYYEPSQEPIDPDDEAEGEVVELPATALRKEESEDKAPNNTGN